ncbi:hypothetical protein EJB05_26640 [Eragrostis curvula]|uniref:Generative cell specific-1/HAP2 domain-containing protein n=1 Tax=Eragrostis curvula TaxID=38414 RepID=A0A5J9UKC1_9POAL|nr:hypothetical protein EJB05_26640 [Eragrostis curvula]
MASPRHSAVILTLLALLGAGAGAVEILSNSRRKTCVRDSDAAGDQHLTCEHKIVLNVAVASNSSGAEASVVAYINETAVDNNGTQETKYIRDPPGITFSMSPVDAVFDLVYLKARIWNVRCALMSCYIAYFIVKFFVCILLHDVAYKPVEQFVETRKCEPDAGADVVKSCERLRNENGSIIKQTEPVCCPCGPHQRVSTSCGNIIDEIAHGKCNTAHCLRFPGEWFHVFKIGKWFLGFSIRVQVKTGLAISEVVVSPDKRTVLSGDKFLRLNIIDDFAPSAKIIPSFEDVYLVTPRKFNILSCRALVVINHQKTLAMNIQGGCWWKNIILHTMASIVTRSVLVMRLSETNRIFAQRHFNPVCQISFGTSLRMTKSDKKGSTAPIHCGWAISTDQSTSSYNAGVHSFSVGVTEVLHTNLLLELRADDIKYVYQRSSGKILRVNVSSIEALSQVGTANVTTKNIGKLEAKYSLTFNCSSGINRLEEQFFTMKPEEESIQLFYLYTSTDQAAEYHCTGVLEIIVPPDEHKKGGTMGFPLKPFGAGSGTVLLASLLAAVPNVQAFPTRVAVFLHRKGYFGKHQKHRSGPSHRHHHILHRSEEDEPGTAAGGPQHRHDHPALGLQRKDSLRKKRHGRTETALHIDG